MLETLFPASQQTPLSTLFSLYIINSHCIIVDVNELPSNIFRRGAIWGKNQKLHANRIYLDKCWKDIASEMKVEV